MSGFVSPFDSLGASILQVEGHMQCVTCYDDVAEGTYDPTKKMLKYTCANGHENIVENYQL
jgi:hypothetical protein